MTDNRYPPLIGKVDERMIIIAYMCTSQILAEWRRSPVIANLDNNNLKDDAAVINRVTGYFLGVSCAPFTEEQIKTLQLSTDGLTSRETELSFSMCEYCLTGETIGEAEVFVRSMAEMQQICGLINQQRAQQAQAEANSKVQAATSMIDLSAVRPKGFNQ